MREALGVSGVDMATLLCVHPVSIYHWAGVRSKKKLVGFPLLVAEAWVAGKWSISGAFEFGARLKDILILEFHGGQIPAIAYMLGRLSIRPSR